MSYHDGPSDRSTVIREDTDFLDSNVYKINSTGNSMFIKYYSAIEQPRVYGFLLNFHCIPTASTMFKRNIHEGIDSPDEDCFIEDNTIEFKSTKQSQWIPRSGDRHYKKTIKNKEHLERKHYRLNLC